MSTALSLVCQDCGFQIKSAAAAQDHAEVTGHVNFAESTEAVLQLVCKECGKPCSSATEKDLHTKRTGHSEFVDKTQEAAGPVDMTPQVSVDYMEVDKPAAGAAAAAAEPAEMVPPTVDAAVLAQLEEMGFPKVRSERALHFSGDNLEQAINWLAEHAEDANIDEPLLVPKAEPKVQLTPEEKKAKLEAMLEKTRKEKAKRERELEKEREADRIRSSKELQMAAEKAAETQMRLDREAREREKRKALEERERLRAELAKDRAERLAREGKSIDPSAETKVEDPHRRKVVAVKSCIRKLYSGNRSPEGAAVAALTMASKIVGNIAKNPQEEKFRGVRTTHPAVNAALWSKKAAPELMTLIGFEADGERVVLKKRWSFDNAEQGDADVVFLEKIVAELEDAITKGPFY